MTNKQTAYLVRNIWRYVKYRWKNEINIYFISGMCYNCSVFDGLKLPSGYRKKYLKWYVPRPDESLEEYSRTLAKEIDTTRPFVLVGYSFGGIIVQEMGKFLSPVKIIIISSFKSDEEIPMLFKAAKRLNVAERIPPRMYASTELITEIFNRLVYHVASEELSQVMTFTHPVYIKWAIYQITNWIPHGSKHIYHIHGTEDQIFSYTLLHNVFPIEGGDHLMVMKRADVVSSIISSILLMKEN